MLLAMLPTGIRTEAAVAQFKDRGGWKNTHVHFDITFTTDSTEFKNKLSALKSIMQNFDNLDFRLVANFHPVAFKINNSQRPMAVQLLSQDRQPLSVVQRSE